MAVNFTIETRRIVVKKAKSEDEEEQFFDVRGLNTEDFTFLTTEYLEDIAQAVARAAGPSGRIHPSKRQEVISDIASQFPDLAAETISRCAEAREDKAKFRQLGVLVTMNALAAIYELTVLDGGADLGKVGGGLASLLEAQGLKLGPLANQLKNTIESAAKMSPSSTTGGIPMPDGIPSES